MRAVKVSSSHAKVMFIAFWGLSYCKRLCLLTHILNGKCTTKTQGRADILLSATFIVHLRKRIFKGPCSLRKKMKVLGIYLTYMAKAMGWFWWLVAYFWCKCRHVSLVYDVWSQKECSIFIWSHVWRSRSNLLSHKEVFCLLTLNLSLARIKLVDKICSNFMNDSKFQLNSTVFLNTSPKYIIHPKLNQQEQTQQDVSNDKPKPT